MRDKQASGGIERKFLTSILWVGVIPMTLALIIGYVFAREGQQIAVQQNLATAARKTAQGVRLALDARLRMAARMAQDPDVITVLKKHHDGASFELELSNLHRRLSLAAGEEGDIQSRYSLYDAGGSLIFTTDPDIQYEVERPSWVSTLEKASFVEFAFLEVAQRYAVTSACPVIDPDSDLNMGYLSETQGVQDLLEFVLGRETDAQNPLPEGGGNLYDVILLGETRELAVHREASLGGPAILHYDTVDPQFSRRIRNAGEASSGVFTQLRYKTRDQEQRVLMAYHRLLEDAPFYVLVFRPTSAVFANVNLAAILTIVVSGLVIGVFCIIAYRFVNNNIIRPVSLLNEGAQIIRQGDLELKLVIETGDEIEELASSFNRMATALRHNINQLEESEEKYRSLITSMRDGIYQTDQNGVLTFMNPAGAEILGYGQNEGVIGTNLREMFIEQIDFARVSSELERQRFVERTRVWMKKQGGRSICVEFSCNRIFDELRTVVGLEGTFRDVTQNVRLEQEARERSERISAINQIANVINSSLEAGRVYESIVAEVRKLVSFDYAAVALLTNDGKAFETRQLWPEPSNGSEAGFPRIEQAGGCASWVAQERRCLIVNRLRDEALDFSQEYPEEIQSCICVPLYATGRIIGTLNLGAREPAAFSKYETEVLEQMALHVAVAIRNATLLDNLQHSLEEVTRAREKLHEANEELKTLDEMKTNLLSNVSHELRTPLVAVMGYTDMLLNEKAGSVNELQSEYLGISLRNIEKLVTLIENLLDFSRLHRGTEELLFDSLDLIDCAKTSMQIIQPLAEGRDIELVLEAPETEVLVEGDKGKLGQVFNNLLSNAIKFNHSGGRVTIDIRESDGKAEVVVRDTGIGIPEEALDKIFTRFYQYDGSSTRKYGGTGIGLSIAQDIMRLHGSRISVSSQSGAGSTFRFVLPLSGSGRQTEEGDGGIKIPMPTETHLLIELVSQDRALGNQIRSMLVSEAMDVILATYAAAAVTLAEKYRPDCILVDSEAGPSGSVVLTEILASTEVSGIPIILLTDDDALHSRFRSVIAGRAKRSFRKSSLLSGIHYALSKGMPQGDQLGNKVLCVDDDSEIVTFISRCLEGEGYATDRCRTGEEALEMVQDGSYWMVLLDIAMPGMDGWETCERIKSNPALAGIRVYMVSAKPVDKSVAELHASGADGYLQKPFRAEDLLELVQGFESRRAATSQ